MVQEIIVCLLFVLALAYIVRLLYLSFRPKGGKECSRGCGGSCSTSNVKKLEALMKK